jgi:hypothetical protein
MLRILSSLEHNEKCVLSPRYARVKGIRLLLIFYWLFLYEIDFLFICRLSYKMNSITIPTLIEKLPYDMVYEIIKRVPKHQPLTPSSTILKKQISIFKKVCIDHLTDIICFDYFLDNYPHTYWHNDFTDLMLYKDVILKLKEEKKWLNSSILKPEYYHYDVDEGFSLLKYIENPLLTNKNKRNVYKMFAYILETFLEGFDDFNYVIDCFCKIFNIDKTFIIGGYYYFWDEKCVSCYGNRKEIMEFCILNINTNKYKLLCNNCKDIPKFCSCQCLNTFDKIPAYYQFSYMTNYPEFVNQFK